MSNLSGSVKSKNQSSKDSEKTKRWSLLQNNLSEAVHTWQELEKVKTQSSPEEKQFAEMKLLIEQLREKLAEF